VIIEIFVKLISFSASKLTLFIHLCSNYQFWTQNRLPFYKYFQIFKVDSTLTAKEQYIHNYVRWFLPVISLLATLPYILANITHFDTQLPYLRFCLVITYTLLSSPPATYADKKVVELVFSHFNAKIASSTNMANKNTKNNHNSDNTSAQMKRENNSGAGGEILPASGPSSPLTKDRGITSGTRNQMHQQPNNSVQFQFDVNDRLYTITQQLKNQKIDAVKSRLKWLIYLNQILGVFILVAIVLAELVFRESMSG
jgi:hypothetical protein